MTDTTPRPRIDGPAEEACCCKAGRFFTARRGLRRPAHGHQERRPRGRRLLPRPMEPRQGRSLDPRRQLHRFVLLEGLRQGRDHHLGDPADGLPIGRRQLAGVRAPWLPARCRLQLVHLLADPDPLPLRPGACCWRCTARPSPGCTIQCCAWADVVNDPDTSQPVPEGPRQGRPGSGELGRSRRDHRCRTRPHHQAVRPRPRLRLLPHSCHVDGVSRRRRTVHQPHRWARCCRSTTGTPTYPSHHRRCSATRPTSPSRPTGSTPRYLMMWGSNVPVTRTPDAHFMTEARYRGQKVVVVSPDYADNTKFADEWLAPHPGTDGALGDGDGPRHSQGVLRRPTGPQLRRLREEVHRPAVPGEPA